jgi:hypothetical protein
MRGGIAFTCAGRVPAVESTATASDWACTTRSWTAWSVATRVGDSASSRRASSVPGMSSSWRHRSAASAGRVVAVPNWSRSMPTRLLAMRSAFRASASSRCSSRREASRPMPSSSSRAVRSTKSHVRTIVVCSSCSDNSKKRRRRRRFPVGGGDAGAGRSGRASHPAARTGPARRGPDRPPPEDWVMVGLRDAPMPCENRSSALTPRWWRRSASGAGRFTVRHGGAVGVGRRRTYL